MAAPDTEQPMRGWTGSSEDLEELLKFAADAITVQGPTGALLWANDAAARQVGFDTASAFLEARIAEVLDRHDLIDESGNPLPLEALPGRRALSGETGPAAVVGFRIKGEPEERWSLVQATPVLHGGAVSFVINVFHDITELKRTEARVRLLADAGAVLGASIDYQTTLQDLAEMVVPTLADWCVVDVIEETGLRRVAVAHPDPELRALAEELQARYPPDPDQPGGVREVVRTGEPQIVPEISDEMLAAAARDAEHLALLRGLGLGSAAILPLTTRGQTLGALSLARTATSPRYRTEDLPFLEDLARRAALAVDNSRLLHEANEAVRMRDEFLAMASHDMRTPLGVILANVQLAHRRLAGEGDSDPRGLGQFLENAERTVWKLAQLVDELMDITMLRSGQLLPLDRKSFDLADVTRQVVAEHQRVSEGHAFRVEGDASLIGSWDRMRVERVLDNLIDNAVKYSPDGGEIVVSVVRDDGDAVVSVTDRGIGIPAEDLPRIFTPYQRASNARGLRGIGLGLAGAREVLRQLGGDVTVETLEGAGSTFVVRLPLA